MTSLSTRPACPTAHVAVVFRPAVNVALAVVAAAAMVSPAALAQEPVKFAESEVGSFAPNTVVARYRIDPVTLEGVTTTAELVAALRQHLVVEASMPLDEPLYVHLAGNVASPRASNAYMLQSNQFTFVLAAGASVTLDLASVVRASHQAETFSDWDEEAAWAWLIQRLDDALSKPTSVVAQASGPRARNDAGHVRLGIAAVHVVPADDEAWDMEERFERDYIELGPMANFGSSALAGWEPPEGLAYDTQVIFLELEPATEADRAAPEEPAAIDLSPEALERFVGDYELGPDAILEIWREGDVLKAAPREGKTDMATLTPLSETEFSTDVGGDRTIMRFKIGADGAVESVTMDAADGFKMTLPRIR